MGFVESPEHQQPYLTRLHLGIEYLQISSGYPRLQRLIQVMDGVSSLVLGIRIADGVMQRIPIK